MTFVYLSPVGVSFLLLSAHFMHADNAVMVAAALALLGLLALRQRWVPPVLQVALVLGALEWLRTGVLLVQERSAMEQPWTRLALILGAVAALTALSALLLLTPRARAYFNPKGIVAAARG
ncbi:MAG: hypothetical protein AUJ20_05355 [Comamonadaceae bacterium CG1_02_60_18]|nr:MAG: hypothetical protein AUJ20_05355 [Comamonadaceae bacterium CG1_02_60_18]PIQ53763.1 MAG: hypothetical protein COW02_07105 [Comamonadaceae bacterium CG12_big_fil_rev_8_21_14_0_65_59_15]